MPILCKYSNGKGLCVCVPVRVPDHAERDPTHPPPRGGTFVSVIKPTYNFWAISKSDFPHRPRPVLGLVWSGPSRAVPALFHA
jgi:hypothetical protein